MAIPKLETRAEGLNILFYAGLFKGGHVFIPTFYRNNHPGVTGGYKLTVHHKTGSTGGINNSEQFNNQFPDTEILVYEKTEDGFELLHTFLNGERLRCDDVIHYQKELEKVCNSLNKRASKHSMPYYTIISVARHPTVAFHGGAFTFIGYIVFELYEDHWRFHLTPPLIGHGCQNYNFLPNRIKAMQLLNDYLLTIRDAGKLAEIALPRPKRHL